MPREGQERVLEVHRRRALLPPALWRDPAFVIGSGAWDTFARWEWNTERRAGYLGDTDWDRAWVPEDYSSGDEDEDFEEEDDEEGTSHDEAFDEDEDDNLDFSVFEDGCQPSPLQPPSPPAPAGGCSVSSRVHEGHVVRDDTEDFFGNVAYNVLRARDNSEHYLLPPELTEDQELQVAVLVSAQEEKRAFLGLEDALFISVAPPPPPRRQAPPSPLRAPPRPGHAEADEAWDPWPEADAPAIGWLPPPPPPPPGSPPPPMADWPWPQGPFIDLTLDEDGDDRLP
jgi:hypothetical protein